jgi:putative hydrolase of HD superfamily
LKDLSRIVAFYRSAAGLKDLKRAGWKRCGLTACESVAEHTFGVNVLVLALSTVEGVDRGKCLALATVHDLAEAVVGDITPKDGVSAEGKRRREREAISEMAETLADAEIISLWEEYEVGETAEAKLVRDLDGIEMALQAREYQLKGMLGESDAEEFIASARERVTTDMGREMIRALFAKE